MFLTHALPVGFVGLFAAVMFAAMLSTDDTYMHSWGSIFVQDVILPFRKKPFTEKQHLWLLRGSIIFVGVFAFFFSWLFKQTEYIVLYFQITGCWRSYHRRSLQPCRFHCRCMGGNDPRFRFGALEYRGAADLAGSVGAVVDGSH